MKYYQITNGDGKQWVMPAKNMRVGMMLYQPSAWTGKMLKAFLPLVIRFRAVRKALHIECCDLPLDPVTKNYLIQQFKDANLDYAFFMGTPSKNQKITIQISKGVDILGYCKLSKSERIYELFLGEQQTLDYLSEKGFDNIPRCLDCTQLTNGYYVFLQSTIKTIHYAIGHELTAQHFAFADELKERTSVKVAYNDSDFGKMMTLLRDHLDAYESDDGVVLKQALDLIDDWYKDKTVYCVFHGDFTPWNTFTEKGKLFVFDFEYAKRFCPPYMDLMHFVGQVGLLEKNLDGKGLYNYVMGGLSSYCSDIHHSEVLYLSYLLYIFTFYSEIFSWEFPQEDIGYRGWMSQILILNNHLCL